MTESRSRKLPHWTEYDGALGVGIPFDDPYWDAHRRHAARRRKEWDRLNGNFTDEELDRTFDQDYGGGVWTKPNPTVTTPNSTNVHKKPPPDSTNAHKKTKEAAEQLNRKFKDVELAQRKNNLIKEFEKFLNETNSDVPGRDEMRDKIRDFKNEEKKHVLKDVTC